MNWRDMTMLEYINSEDRGFFLPDMGTNGLKLVGYTTYEVYLDPRKQLELALKMNEVFESDFIYSLCDGVIFCEALGLDLLKPDYDFPSVKDHPIRTIQDIRKLEVPNPHTSPRMAINLEGLKMISDNIDKPLYVSIQGPFTLAIQLAGATHLLRCIIKDKEFVKEILKFTLETVKQYAIAVNKAGAKYISIAEPATVTLRPSHFEEMVVPSFNEIFDALDCWKGMHICGDTSRYLDMMLGCNIDAISLDQLMDYKVVAPKIPENIVLIGNLDPIELIGQGTLEEIREGTLALKNDMKEYRNHLFDFGCNCLNNTPVENIQEALAIARS